MALAPARSGHGGVYMPFQRVSSVRLQLHQPAHLHHPHHHHHHHHHSQQLNSHHLNSHSHHQRSHSKPFTSFFIKDILGSKIGGPEKEAEALTATATATASGRAGASPPCPSPVSPASPWSAPAPAAVPVPTVNDTGASQPSPPVKEAAFPARPGGPDTVPSAGGGGGGGAVKKDANGSPLSALEELANKTFTGLETSILRAAEAATVSGKRDPLHLFNRQPPRKKRKSRTAFNNQQIFELERRFIYQKYLTPADRDEIASVLGLSNAQVITWFQNRRAKLKRDMEELTMDVTAASTKRTPGQAGAGPDDAPAGATAAVSPSAPKAARLEDEEEEEELEEELEEEEEEEEEEEVVEEEDEEDRLSTASEYREQTGGESLGMGPVVSDDNSPHHGHRRHLSPTTHLLQQLHQHHHQHLHHRHRHPINARPHRLANLNDEAGEAAALDSAGDEEACGGAAESEEVESMDCSTSPSSGVHSDNEDSK